jgi:hypothetical protein
MALIFEPDRVVYDPDEGLLRIFATDGLMLARCAVSKAALIALEDDAQAGVDAMLTTYRRNRDLIHDIAQRKYRARQFEAGGVVVRVDDVTARLAAQPPRAATAAALRDKSMRIESAG